jgi:hypothetical protein
VQKHSVAKEACHALVQPVKNVGGADDITVVAAYFNAPLMVEVAMPIAFQQETIR